MPPAGVLSNDSDPDGDPLSAVLASGPANGTLALNANGSFTYTPGADFYGTDGFSYKARDGAGAESAPASVTITVSAVNDPPLFDPLGPETVDEDASTQTVVITGVSPGPANEGTQTVSLSATSSDPAVVPDPTISGSGATRTLSYQAAPNANGVVMITVAAQDDGGTGGGGQNTFSRTFTLTVNAVNDPPAFDPIAGQTVDEDANTQAVTITGVSPGPLNETSQTVSFAATSSDPAVVPNPTISGTGATRTLSYQPAPNANGTVAITVIAQDSGGTALGGQDIFSRTFAIAVIPVPDADLTLTKGVAPSVVFVGEPVTYTIIVANAGPDAAQDVELTDSVPTTITVTSVTTTQGSCTGTGPVACAIGTLASGASVSVTIVAATTATGILTNTASAMSATSDPTPANNSASATLQVSPRGHDVGIAGGGFALSTKHDLSRSGPVETVKIKLKNYGRLASEAISYSVTSSVGDALSSACFGTTPTLAPGKTYTVVGCTITYAGTGSRAVTLTTAHDDTDGAIDEDLTNNTASRNVTVQP